MSRPEILRIILPICPFAHFSLFFHNCNYTISCYIYSIPIYIITNLIKSKLNHTGLPTYLLPFLFQDNILYAMMYVCMDVMYHIDTASAASGSGLHGMGWDIE